MHDTLDPTKPMAVIKVAGASILLNAEAAVEVFRLLNTGILVEYSYSKEGFYKKETDRYNMLCLESFSVEAFAKLMLSED